MILRAKEFEKESGRVGEKENLICVNLRDLQETQIN